MASNDLSAGAIPSSPLLSLVTGSSLPSHGHCQDGRPTGRQGWVWQAQRVTSCGSYLGRASEGSQQWRDLDAEVSADAVTQGCHRLRPIPSLQTAPVHLPLRFPGVSMPPTPVSLNLDWASGNAHQCQPGLGEAMDLGDGRGGEWHGKSLGALERGTGRAWGGRAPHRAGGSGSWELDHTCLLPSYLARSSPTELRVSADHSSPSRS